MTHRIICALLILLGAGVGTQDQEQFELKGVIALKDGGSLRDLNPVVFLHGATFPFAASALADPSGQFRFKDLERAAYRLIIVIPYQGEMEKSIDIGPSLADSQGKITMSFLFEPELSSNELATVSADQLTVPEKAQSEFRKALKELGKKNVEKATAHLLKAIDLAPHYSVALNQLGTMAFQGARYVEAEDYFRRALKADPGSYAPLVNLGAALLLQNKLEEALERNREAVLAKPSDPLAYSQLGQTHYALGSLEEALTHLIRAKSLDPAHFSHPQLVLARIYLEKGNHELVVQEIRSFLAHHPDSDLAPQLAQFLANEKDEK